MTVIPLVLLLFALRHALVFALLAATAWSAGSVAIRLALAIRSHGAVRDDDSATARAVTAGCPMRIAIGLALLTQTALLLGLCGWLRAPIVAILAIAIVIAAAGEWRRLAARARQALTKPRPATLTNRTLATWALVAIVACPPFVLALYPPLGFDQTLYHLPYARAFAASGGLPFLTALRYPVFPQLAEALDAAVLLLAGEVATQMVGWLALTGCAGLAYAWAREESSAAGGWIAAALLVGSPIVVYLGATGYVEPLVGLFGLASLYAADRASREGRAKGVAWIVAAGALAGSAASVKYLGLFFVPAAALLCLPRTLGRDSIAWRQAPRALAWFALAAAAALAPMYGRLLALTGNPLFPFYPAIFGHSAWDSQEYLGRRGLSRLAAVSTFLWDMTFRREAVGGLPMWSPAFAIGAPLAAYAAWRDPRVRRWLIAAVAYPLVAPVNSHYFLAIAPLWCVIIGVAASRLATDGGAGVDAADAPTRDTSSRPVAGRRLLIVTAVILALGGDAYTLYRVHTLGLPPATPDGRARLLAAQLPLYPAIAFLNRTAGPVTVYGLHAENMVAHASGTFLGDQSGPASYTHVAARALALGSLASALDEIGAAYLAIPNRPLRADQPLFWEERARWTAQASADPRLVRIYDDGGGTLYRVLPPS